MARTRFIAVLGCLLLMVWGADLVWAGPPPDGPGESLADLYRAVLKNPRDSKVNLRYARLAEVQGQPRLALAAYERVILNDPGNREAQAGFARLKRQLEPSLSQFALEVGSGYDTNPLNDHRDAKGEPVFFASFSMRDERSITSVRWRTLVNAYGEYPLNIGELLYAYAGVQTGPLLDVAPGLTLYPAVGTAFSSLDKRLFYGEGNLSLTMEGRFGGAFQSVRLRGGYRSYGDGFAADRGYYTDIVGRLSIPALFGGSGTLVIRPWARWSGISGITFDALNEEATPGRYAEWAMEVAYYFKPMSDLTLGVSVEGRQRQFFETHALNGARRADIFLSPGFSATRSNILSCACDLLLDYNYRLNQSNDSDSRYQGHRVTLSFASHF